MSYSKILTPYIGPILSSLPTLPESSCNNTGTIIDIDDTTRVSRSQPVILVEKKRCCLQKQQQQEESPLTHACVFCGVATKSIKELTPGDCEGRQRAMSMWFMVALQMDVDKRTCCYECFKKYDAAMNKVNESDEEGEGGEEEESVPDIYLMCTECCHMTTLSRSYVDKCIGDANTISIRWCNFKNDLLSSFSSIVNLTSLSTANASTITTTSVSDVDSDSMVVDIEANSNNNDVTEKEVASEPVMPNATEVAESEAVPATEKPPKITVADDDNNCCGDSMTEVVVDSTTDIEPISARRPTRGRKTKVLPTPAHDDDSIVHDSDTAADGINSFDKENTAALPQTVQKRSRGRPSTKAKSTAAKRTSAVNKRKRADSTVSSENVATSDDDEECSVVSSISSSSSSFPRSEAPGYTGEFTPKETSDNNAAEHGLLPAKRRKIQPVDLTPEQKEDTSSNTTVTTTTTVKKSAAKRGGKSTAAATRGSTTRGRGRGRGRGGVTVAAATTVPTRSRTRSTTTTASTTVPKRPLYDDSSDGDDESSSDSSSNSSSSEDSDSDIDDNNDSSPSPPPSSTKNNNDEIVAKNAEGDKMEIVNEPVIETPEVQMQEEKKEEVPLPEQIQSLLPPLQRTPSLYESVINGDFMTPESTSQQQLQHQQQGCGSNDGGSNGAVSHQSLSAQIMTLHRSTNLVLDKMNISNNAYLVAVADNQALKSEVETLRSKHEEDMEQLHQMNIVVTGLEESFRSMKDQEKITAESFSKERAMMFKLIETKEQLYNQVTRELSHAKEQHQIQQEKASSLFVPVEEYQQLKEHAKRIDSSSIEASMRRNDEVSALVMERDGAHKSLKVAQDEVKYLSSEVSRVTLALEDTRNNLKIAISERDKAQKDKKMLQEDAKNASSTIASLKSELELLKKKPQEQQQHQHERRLSLSSSSTSTTPSTYSPPPYNHHSHHHHYNSSNATRGGGHYGTARPSSSYNTNYYRGFGKYHYNGIERVTITRDEYERERSKSPSGTAGSSNNGDNHKKDQLPTVSATTSSSIPSSSLFPLQKHQTIPSQIKIAEPPQTIVKFNSSSNNKRQANKDDTDDLMSLDATTPSSHSIVVEEEVYDHSEEIY